MPSASDNLEALYRLAFKEFQESGQTGSNRWKELNNELASVINDLTAADFAGPGAFVSKAADAYRATGKAVIKERLAKYLEVGLREGAPALLAPPWTERLRSEIENSIEAQLQHSWSKLSRSISTCLAGTAIVLLLVQLRKHGRRSAQEIGERRAFRRELQWLRWETEELARDVRAFLRERKRQQKRAEQPFPFITAMFGGPAPSDHDV